MIDFIAWLFAEHPIAGVWLAGTVVWGIGLALINHGGSR